MRQAAEILFLSQPSLTATVQKLEQELGCCLFDRIAHRIRLTKEGKVFLAHCETIEQEIRNSIMHMEELAQKNKTVINIGCVEPLLREYLPKKMREFLELPENDGIQFHITEATTPEMVACMKKGDLDLILGSETEDGALQQFPLMESPLVMICRQNDPQAEKKHFGIAAIYSRPFCSWDALSKMVLLGYTKRSVMDHVLEEMWLSRGITLNYRYRMPHETAIISLVANGFGAAVIPWVSDLKNFAVDIYPLPSGTYHRRLCIASRRDHNVLAAANKFVDFLLSKEEQHAEPEWGG